MGAYLVKRLVTTIVVFFVISIAVFALVKAAPGDPIAMMIPPEQYTTATPEFIEMKRHELGLDRPVPLQYLSWLGGVFRGDLGYSIFNNQPVLQMLGQRVAPTLELMLTATLISIVIAIPLGVLAAVRKNGPVDYTATVLSLIAISTPPFFIGIIAIYTFSLKLRVLPSSGMSTPGDGSLPDLLKHLAMPAIILGLAGAGQYTRYVRASVVSELTSQYVRTARAKGMSMGAIMFKHVLRNSMIPVITIIALSLPLLLGGAVILEQIFSWPGMGQLAVTAVSRQDYSVIVAFAMMTAGLVLLSNLIADLLYAVVDPRVRLS